VRREGKKFNKLTALYPVGKDGKRLMWLCQCDCGNYATVASANLHENPGATKSCGCLWNTPNEFEITPEGVRLYLVSYRTNTKSVVWVDEEDLELVREYHWSVVRGGNTFYATYKMPGDIKSTKMHRKIPQL